MRPSLVRVSALPVNEYNMILYVFHDKNQGRTVLSVMVPDDRTRTTPISVLLGVVVSGESDSFRQR